MALLREQQAEAARLDEAVWKNLKALGMTLEELLQAKREEILKVCAKYGAHNVRVFGSVARGRRTNKATLT